MAEGTALQCRNFSSDNDENLNINSGNIDNGNGRVAHTLDSKAMQVQTFFNRGDKQAPSKLLQCWLRFYFFLQNFHVKNFSCSNVDNIASRSFVVTVIKLNFHGY